MKSLLIASTLTVLLAVLLGFVSYGSDAVRSSGESASSSSSAARLSTGASTSSQQSSMLDQAIMDLFAMVNTERYTTSKPFQWPTGWGYEAGRWKNYIHLNIVGNPIAQALRKAFAIPDNNMFVTQFVAEALVEAGVLSPDLAPVNDTVIAEGLGTSLRHKDKRWSNETPIFGFWEQEWKKQDLAGGLYGWRQWSINMSPELGTGKNITNFIQKIFDGLGMKKEFEKLFGSWSNLFNWFYGAFNIPPDADDTNTMIAFTHWLNALPNTLSESKELWGKQNFNLSKAYDKMIEAAYCPVKNASDLSGATDSRSFYWAREFIWNNLTDVDDCLVSTWIETFPYMASVYNQQQAGPINPLNANNLDSSVCANTLYGMSVALLQGTPDSTQWFERADGKGKKLYLTTAKLVAWALQQQSTIERPDLEMLYYPAVVNFPYFVARHLRLLESTPRPFPFPEVQEVYDLLSSAARNGGVTYFLDSAKFDCDGVAGPSACWDGFLGQGDTNSKGEPTPHYDDRFYTTAVAVNTLLDSFTYTENSNGTGLRWISNSTTGSDGKDGVPAYVKGMITQGLTYLINTYNNVSISKENTFFSGSVKSINGLNWFTPTNYLRNMKQLPENIVYNCNTSHLGEPNGGLLNNISVNMFWTVAGVWPKEEYESLINGPKTCANNYLPCCGDIPIWTRFEGYNDPKQPYPFWSAPVLSNVYAMLAFSKVRALNDTTLLGF